MQVEIRIDPACRQARAVITAPAMTDELRALAARLEGRGALTGWREGQAFPLEEGEILRCYGEEKGVRAQITVLSCAGNRSDHRPAGRSPHR